MEKQVIAIVPAAGLGKRFDASGRKTFVKLEGIPLLIHTLRRLQEEPFARHRIGKPPTHADSMVLH